MNPTSPSPPPDNALRPCKADEFSMQNAELQPIGRPRPKLFYERYGIGENPFGVTPNPRYLYQSKTHAEARASLIIGIECGVGFQALIAPPGMGKTTLLFDVLQRFKNVASTAFLFQIHGDSCDFLHYLISELGGEAHDSDVVRMQDTINELLIRERRAGRQAIVVIDEAQMLNSSVLETVRLLSNFETPAEKLIQIILAGQPKLAQRLANPEMAQLHQRISMLTTLLPFGLEDTKNYIEHRLMIAGYKGPPLFTSAAVRLIWESSGGVPREINTLCFNALLLARAAEQKQVHPAIFSWVVADLDLDRIRLNTGTPPSGMRGVQTTNGLSLGNAAEDPPATSIDRTCKAAISGAEPEADAASTRLNACDGVDPLALGTIAAEIFSIGSGEKAEQASVPAAKTGAEDTSTPPTTFDGVDLVKSRTMAAEIVSTGSGEKAEQASVPTAKTGAEDTSTPPTTFEGVDLVKSRTMAAEIVSTGSGEKAEEPAVSGAKTEADDPSTRPTAFDEVELVQLGEIAPKRDLTSFEKRTIQPRQSGD